MLTLQQLESHLWGAADILRGKIDSSDNKHYIFGLLFFKRICDVWGEEYEQRLSQYNDKENVPHIGLTTMVKSCTQYHYHTAPSTSK